MTTYFKYPQFFSQTESDVFDKVYEPGDRVPASGIYRCEGCGGTATCVHSHVFPPQNHHQHSPAQGRIRWRAVATSGWR